MNLKSNYRLEKEKEMLKAKIGVIAIIGLIFLSGFSAYAEETGAPVNTPVIDSGGEVDGDADVIENEDSDKPEKRSSSGGGYNKKRYLVEIIRLLEIKLELLKMLNLR